MFRPVDLAAALLGGLFEHPEWSSPAVQDVQPSEALCPPSCPQLAKILIAVHSGEVHAIV